LIGWAIEVPESDDVDVDETKPLHLYRTADGGQTWREVTTVDWYGQLRFESEKVGWALVESDAKTVLMHTTDGGETWERLIPRTVSYEVTPPIDVTPQLFIPSELQPIEPGNVHELQIVAEVPAENATQLGFHPNGDAVFITHDDGTLTRWIIDGTSAPSIARIHTDWIYDLDFSLDGYWIATASKDGSLKLEGIYAYQAIPTNDLQTLIMDDIEVTCVAFSADGNTLAAGNEDQAILVWQYSEWGFDTELLSSLEGHTGWVWDVVFSPDGRTLASASSDRTVRLWDLEGGAGLHTLIGHTSTVRRVVFSPDGQTLASASWDGTLKLWDVPTGQELHTLSEHDGWVNDVAFSPVGELLASGSADGLVFLWDPDDGDVLGILRDYNSDIRALAFSPDGRLLATVSEDGKLRFWGVTP
jgi:WD40 repeat protein